MSAAPAPTRVELASGPLWLAWCEVGQASAAQLGPSELPLHERGKTPKRRAEFCAGRLAAHRALEAAAPGLGPLEVLPRTHGADHGRPLVAGHPELAVSISHAAGWAVAAAAFGAALGVDVERADLAADPAFISEAFAPGELERWGLLPAALQPSRTAVAWAAKEAALKVWGVGLRAPLGAVAVVPREFGVRAPGFSLQLELCVEGAWPALGAYPSALDALLFFQHKLVLVVLAETAAAGRRPVR